MAGGRSLSLEQGVEMSAADLWCMGSSPHCLTLPFFTPVSVAVALEEVEEQRDETLEPCVEEGPDDVVSATLKREASVHRREFVRRWGLSQSSQHSPLAPALLFRRSGGLGASLGAFLQRRDWEPSCQLLPPPARLGKEHLILPCIVVPQPHPVVFSETPSAGLVLLLEPRALISRLQMPRASTKLIQSCARQDTYPRGLQGWCPSTAQGWTPRGVRAMQHPAAPCG